MFVSNFKTINHKIISQIQFSDFLAITIQAQSAKPEDLNREEDGNLMISCQHTSKEVLIKKKKKKEQLFWKISIST